MANQTIAKPLGLIKDIKILVHGIPYVVTFTIIQNNVLDSNYYMLLSHHWLKDAKMFHDWGNNIIIVHITNIVKTIHVIKKLGAPTKLPKLLVCYDFHFRISNEKEDLMFATKPRLFSLGTIVVPTLICSYQLVKLIILASLNLVEPMFKSLILFDILVKPTSILPINITIPLNIF
jgi:hypothetical protein